jgi:hypothetical protein
MQLVFENYEHKVSYLSLKCVAPFFLKNNSAKITKKYSFLPKERAMIPNVVYLYHIYKYNSEITNNKPKTFTITMNTRNVEKTLEVG